MKTKKEMTFWEHIYELRRRIFIILISVFLFSVAGYFAFPYFVNLVLDIVGEQLYATDIAEGFLTRLQISVMVGFLLSLPLILFEISLFIFPALKKKEKIFMFLLMISTFILFVLGVAFALKSVLPISVVFLKAEIFFPDNIGRLISYKSFIMFFFQFLLGFGVCFQFPVVLIFLLKIGALKISFLIKNFKYFIVICFLISAIITPPDVISQILLAVPMLLLYLISIIIGKLFKLGVQ